MSAALNYFDALAAVPGALAALDEICYHRYGGVSDATLQALASRSVQHGKRTSMLEWWSTGNSIEVLLKDLTMGRNAAWQQGALAGVGAVDDEMALYKVDVTNPAAPVVRINRKNRLMRQIYRFVRDRAVRVGATSSSGTLQPVAFINQDGGHVTVVRATAATSFTISGLPAGEYGINYSTGTEFDVNRSDQTITTGGAITTSIPAAGALTVHQLRPAVVGTILNGDTFHLSIRSLKPGFSGVIEANTDLMRVDGWQEVGRVPPSDFFFAWSRPINTPSEFFRFRQGATLPMEMLTKTVDQLTPMKKRSPTVPARKGLVR